MIGTILVMHCCLGCLLISYSLFVDQLTCVHRPWMYQLVMREAQWSFVAGGFIVVFAFSGLVIFDLTHRTPPRIESEAAGER